MQKKYIVPYIARGSISTIEEVDTIKSILLGENTLSCGTYRENFESEFADFIDVKYALSLTNCTVALELATYLMDFEENDEVITTPITYQATAQSLLNKNVKVKFCDVDPNSLGIDPEKLEMLISDNTKAIYLTHYGGLMNDMVSIMKLARRHNVYVIADCAHAIGSTQNAVKAGAYADIACFSFQSYKNMTTLGEGGMITFNNDEWKDRIDRIRSIEVDAIFDKRENEYIKELKTVNKNIYCHEKNSHTHDCVLIKHCGTNSTLSEPAAAAGSIQLKNLNRQNDIRKFIASEYDKTLSKSPFIRLQKISEEYNHVFHLYTFFVESSKQNLRNRFIDYLDENGIEVVQRYFPIHLLPEWRMSGTKLGDCPVAEETWFYKMINLPIYPSMSKYQVKYILKILSTAIDEVFN